MEQSKNVFVVQSYCTCIQLFANRLPHEGETLIGTRCALCEGGKGTGQAIYAKFFGMNVRAIGHVGDDAGGASNKKMLEDLGIDTQYIVLDKELPTGTTAIFTGDDSQNSIIVYPGAAEHYSLADFEAAKDYIKTCVCGGFQYEVNIEQVNESIKAAHSWGIKTMLDPAPAPEKFDVSVLPYVSYIKPNEHEAFLITGIKINDFEDAIRAGQWLLDRGVNEAAVITLGGNGSVCVSKDGALVFPCPKIETVVDSTGAGDCFAGAFLADIAAGKSLYDAMVDASCLGALKTGSEVWDISKILDGSYWAAFENLKKNYIKQIEECHGE